MIYQNQTILDTPVGNNEFSYEARKALSSTPTLIVPQMIEGDLSDVRLGEHIVFQDFNEFDEMQTCTGLQNFVLWRRGEQNIYIIDNHNHAFTCWFHGFFEGKVSRGAQVFHVDQHKDTRIPSRWITKKEQASLLSIEEYCNQVLHVGDFIKPALESGLVNDIVFLDKEDDFKKSYKKETNHIVDIDLDIFAPELKYLNFENVLNTVKALVEDAPVVTFATSPFFIDQSSAIQWLRRVFND